MTTRGADYKRRKNDDYPTPAEVLDVLFENVPLVGPIYDPACGELKRVLRAAKRYGHRSHGRDIIDGQDFLDITHDVNNDIVTNPPYGDRRGTLALRFIERALALTHTHRRRVAMLLPIDFDSGKTRKHVFAECSAFTMKIVLLDRIRWFNGTAGSTNHCWCIWDWTNKRAPIIKYAHIIQG